MDKNKFYITTPIFYVNDQPHVGSALATVCADIIARYQKSIGKAVFFLTGTDEYGAKVALKAKSEKKDPQEFVDILVEDFVKAWDMLNIKYDYFIRTTDPKHKKCVVDFINKVYKKGDIYKSQYEGYYCIGCEAFKTDKDLVEGRCPEHRPEQTIFQYEENYFFKLTKYAPKVLELIEDDEYQIIPTQKKTEIVSKLKDAIEKNELSDLSISRENLDWGIRIPWDEKHAIYVWFDALLNYYSALKMNNVYDKVWPADLHIVGKDILWFHTTIWLAMLLAGKEKLPKKVFATSYFTIDGQKMSKSLGNVIRPSDLVEKYGVDGTRYLLAISLPYHDDADIGYSKFDTRYTSDLANNLGNLVNRVIGLILKKGYIVKNYDFDKNYFPQTGSLFDNYKLHEVLNIIMTEVSKVNLKISDEKLWNKEGKEFSIDVEDIIKSIRKISYNLAPFMPETSEFINDIFSQQPKVVQQVLFPRLI